MDRREDILELRAVTRGFYDIQKIRIATGNRICSAFRAKLGVPLNEKAEVGEKEKAKILIKIKAEYAKITLGMIKFPNKNQFTGTKIISSFTEFCLVRQWYDLMDVEKHHENRVKSIVRDFDLWTKFGVHEKGFGEIMCAVILSEVNIHKCKYSSSLWAYAGLDVAPDGKARSKRKEHLVWREFINKEGKPDKKLSITFNPLVKTKCLGVLGPSFLRAKGPRTQPYYDYKIRLEQHPEWSKVVPAHRHKAANRYMVKMFLIDLYKAWRRIEGLVVYDPYHEAKLGLKHDDTIVSESPSKGEEAA